MSLLRFSRRIAVSANPLVTPALAVRALHTTSIVLADEDSDDFKSKESAHEKEFATRQERQTLMELLSKMERDADPGDVKGKAALNAIFQSNGVKATTKLVSDLLRWKHTTSK